MSIYVDPLFNAIPRTAQARRYGNSWCHLITDGDLEELHSFAAGIGLNRSYFQRSRVPHYDLTPSKRLAAINNGAIAASFEELTELRRYWMSRWNGGKPDWENAKL